MKWWTILLLSIFLVGCGTTELEERSFPMLVVADYENGMKKYKDAFPKEDSMGKLGAKIRDYNHLKVLVLEEDLLEHPVVFESMIKELGKSEIFPRNTYICVMDDVEDLFEMEKDISQDLGSYVEEFLKANEEKKGKLPTLGDCIDEQANHVGDSKLPYLDAEESGLIWQGYVNTFGKMWQE